MKCPICGGSVQSGFTNLPVELEKGLVYVKEVPADICGQCGEIFISDEVAANIEKIVALALDQNAEIEVVVYKGAA